VSVPYRENFLRLCQEIRAGNVALLQCRSFDSGATMHAICVTRKLPSGQMECVPLARLLDHSLNSIVLPADEKAEQWRPELN
jgi:hypothetical protein